MKGIVYVSNLFALGVNVLSQRLMFTNKPSDSYNSVRVSNVDITHTLKAIEGINANPFDSVDYVVSQYDLSGMTSVLDAVQVPFITHDKLVSVTGVAGRYHDGVAEVVYAGNGADFISVGSYPLDGLAVNGIDVLIVSNTNFNGIGVSGDLILTFDYEWIKLKDSELLSLLATKPI